MNDFEEPLVSIVTPVYNTGEYLGECIRSVLDQTYGRFEYVIADNCSTDDSLAIARRFASEDSRVRLIEHQQFLGQLANHNRALGYISEKSRFCKVVQADDWLYPRCIEEMLSVFRQASSVGIVSAYTLLDFEDRGAVYLDGLRHGETVVDGREACRRFLLQGTNVFGSPTSSMVRSEIVRQHKPFYREHSVAADTDVVFRILDDWDFGFVHQVLTYTRRHNDSLLSSRSNQCIWELVQLVLVEKFGHQFLTPTEYSRRRRELEAVYRRAVGERILCGQLRELIDLHSAGLSEAGRDFGWPLVIRCVVSATTGLILNPEATYGRLCQLAAR